MSGSVLNGAADVPGPVAASSALFAGTLVDGETLGGYESADDLSRDEWNDADGNQIATLSGIGLDAFGATITEPVTGTP